MLRNIAKLASLATNSFLAFNFLLSLLRFLCRNMQYDLTFDVFAPKIMSAHGIFGEQE
jgi:hypothetical protein